MRAELDTLKRAINKHDRKLKQILTTISHLEEKVQENKNALEFYTNERNHLIKLYDEFSVMLNPRD